MSESTTAEPLGSPPASEPVRAQPKRRALILVGLVIGGFRFGRELLGEFLYGRYGIWGVVGAAIAFLAMLMGWRVFVRWRAVNGEEYSPERVARQLLQSGLPGPAFDEDGTLIGSSVLAVNQRPKLLEVVTEYGIFGFDGASRGSIRQIAQSRLRRVMRLVTPFDQFFTHHFEIFDDDGNVVLRVTRPRKLFRTKVHVFDAADRYLGRLRQENVFFKIRFTIEDENHLLVGRILAENWRAWDFRFENAQGQEVGRVVKSWEGMAKAVFTQADLYVVRVNTPLAEPLRTLVLAGALSIDLALKQDPQGLNG